MPRGRPTRQTVFRRLSASINELNTKYGGLPTPREAARIWSDIGYLEAHHSTALEGNTLVLRQVEKLLGAGIAVGGQPYKNYLEVQGYGAAAMWVYSQACQPTGDDESPLVILQEVRNIHHAIMSPVWSFAPHPDAMQAESPGSFREHDIMPFDGGMTPPSWPLVSSEMNLWVNAANRLSVSTPTSEIAQLVDGLAGLHNWFERIHPFLDGNGRTGRLVLNLLLVRAGLPPVIVRKEKRQSYLRAMQQADRGDAGPLGQILARAMEDSLYRFIVPNLAGPAREVPLSALATPTLSLTALRLAAARGRLDAHQDTSGVWRSSRRAVAEYEATKRGAARRSSPSDDTERP